jgi:hypothetical protein
MSLTFTLTGNTSVLSSDFAPPIELDSTTDYALALLSFHTYNSIPNIEEGINNKFYFGDDAVGLSHKDVINVPTGAYELNDLELYLQQQLLQKGYIPTTLSDGESYDSYLSLKPNNNTLKCEIKSRFRINFTEADSFGSVLGYSSRFLVPNILYESDIPVNIIKVLTIRVECNIVYGSYYNSSTSHTLYEFAPSSDPGYSINIEPKNLVYLPVLNNRVITNITLRLIDQDGQLVNFRGENIVVRLELKKLNYGISVR